MRRAQTRFAVPDGWIARGFRYEVQPTLEEQWPLVWQHFGARRFAFNWALAEIKANLAARKADPSVAPLAWNVYQLRKAWNQAKDEAAPWWRSCSKEAYASGVADLVAALHLGCVQARPPPGRPGRVPAIPQPPPGPRAGALHHRPDTAGG